MRIGHKVRLGVLTAIFMKKIFSFFQELGFHVLPNHFYSPIPDTRTLKDDLWLESSNLIGVNINEQDQLTLLSLFETKFKTEYSKFPLNKPCGLQPEYYINNGFFGSVDGEILYSMIRHFKPSRIIEIGSGHTTFLAAKAILKNKEENDNYDCILNAIEPYPNEILTSGFPGLSKLIIKKVQDVPLSEFQKLKANDILFIDSSHVLKIGSDVKYEYLEILPRLEKGVIIHSHDIFLPVEYPKNWILRDHIFWNEQYLLQAFLTFNRNFKILWSAYYMHLRYPDKLEKAFSSYSKEKQWPVSFWIKRIK